MEKGGSSVANSKLVNTSYKNGRGSTYCRGCEEKNLFSAIDLGLLPIANELWEYIKVDIDKFPLHLKICKICGLGQVADVVTSERIFKDYRYLSSTSSTFLEHAERYVKECFKEIRFSKKDWVLEIASNDGYLLKNFISHGVTAIGVEPAENVAEFARGIGINTITDFFGSQLALKLYSMYGFPKLIIANNVMAHVPDLNDFIKGLSILCGPNTRVSIENPSLANILLDMQFDTIYHEHYSYLSATSVSILSAKHGLTLMRIEELATHGGSNRYWLGRVGGSTPANDVQVTKFIQWEKSVGLFDESKWLNYAHKVKDVLSAFEFWLGERKNGDGRVVGYGAAAKASTLLNSISSHTQVIHAIADASLEKQGRYMPPNSIKIISPLEIPNYKPTDIVIFPWNIAAEIAEYLQISLGIQARLWSVIPEMREIKNHEL